MKNIVIIALLALVAILLLRRRTPVKQTVLNGTVADIKPVNAQTAIPGTNLDLSQYQPL